MSSRRSVFFSSFFFFLIRNRSLGSFVAVGFLFRRLKKLAMLANYGHMVFLKKSAVLND
jgi:hypothetical protein